MSGEEKKEQQWTIRVPEIEYVEYSVNAPTIYCALNKAMQESTYKLHRTTHLGYMGPVITPWQVKLLGQWVPFGATDDAPGFLWHVWGMYPDEEQINSDQT